MQINYYFIKSPYYYLLIATPQLKLHTGTSQFSYKPEKHEQENCNISLTFELNSTNIIRKIARQVR